MSSACESSAVQYICNCRQSRLLPSLWGKTLPSPASKSHMRKDHHPVLPPYGDLPPTGLAPHLAEVNLLNLSAYFVLSLDNKRSITAYSLIKMIPIILIYSISSYLFLLRSSIFFASWFLLNSLFCSKKKTTERHRTLIWKITSIQISFDTS